MRPPPLVKIELDTSYITPTGRVCRLLPRRAGAEPLRELHFVYVDGDGIGESLTLTPALALRLLKARPRLGLSGAPA